MFFKFSPFGIAIISVFIANYCEAPPIPALHNQLGSAIFGARPESNEFEFGGLSQEDYEQLYSAHELKRFEPSRNSSDSFDLFSKKVQGILNPTESQRKKMMFKVSCIQRSHLDGIGGKSEYRRVEGMVSMYDGHFELKVTKPNVIHDIVENFLGKSDLTIFGELTLGNLEEYSYDAGSMTLSRKQSKSVYSALKATGSDIDLPKKPLGILEYKQEAYPISADEFGFSFVQKHINYRNMHGQIINQYHCW